MEISLKSMTLRGLAWSLIESLGSQGTRFIIGIILARLLDPDMFGLLAMLMIFIVLGEVIVDSGLGTALIQDQSTSELEICSVFYFNAFVGLVAAATLFFTAPIIAEFYAQPQLESMARALSLIFIINAIGMIQSNLLAKLVDFKALAKITTVSSIISGLTGIILALSGFGVWSLVCQQLLAAIIRNGLYWFYGRWRPRLMFSIHALRGLMKYGLSVLGIGILNRTTESVYNMIIGKLFSAGELGFFSRAQQLQGFTPGIVATVVGRVSFPVLSKVQDDQVVFKRTLKKTLVIVSFVICPVMFFILAAAEPLVIVLLTEKWAATIPLLQLSCFIGLLFPLEWIRQQAMQAIGRPDLSLRVEVVKKVILFVSIAITWRWGLFGIIAGMLVASMISFLLNMYYLSTLISFSIKEQILDLMPYFLIAASMGGMILFVRHLLRSWTPLVQLICIMVIGFFCYTGLALLFRTTAVHSIEQEIRNLRTRTFL